MNYKIYEIFEFQEDELIKILFLNLERLVMLQQKNNNEDFFRAFFMNIWKLEEYLDIRPNLTYISNLIDSLLQ